MAAEGKADVGLFYNDADIDKAEAIKRALNDENLRVDTYDDMIAGESKLNSVLHIMKNSCCVVFIVTKNFVTDQMNVWLSDQAIWNGIQERLPKVVPVKYCSAEYPALLKPIVEIDGSLELCEIAQKIGVAVEELRPGRTPAPVEVKNKDYKTKGLIIIDYATEALVNHYDIDNKMMELHQKMKQKIDGKTGNDPDPETNIEGQGCSCRQGEFWKQEINEEEYWVIEDTGLKKPDPFSGNIEKFKGMDKDRKHTADIHKLYKKGGYLKLASVFLFKKPNMPNEPDCKYISEYLDIDGILHLLERCNIFGTDKKERQKIKQVHKVRSNVSHLPLNSSRDEQNKWIDDTAALVKDSLYGLLPRKKWEELSKQISLVTDGTLVLTIHPGSMLARKMELQKCQDQAAQTAGLQENLEDIKLED